jgi:hypothetical protein
MGMSMLCPSALDPVVKAELGSQVSQLMSEFMTYMKKLMEKKEELTKATRQGNQYDNANLVELEVQHEVCGNVPEASFSNVLKEVCQDVARESCYDVPMEVNCTSCEESCDEDSSLNEAEIDDPQGNVQLRDFDEEFVKQDAANELVGEYVKLDNDEKEILAREEEIKQLGRDAEKVFDAVNIHWRGRYSGVPKDRCGDDEHPQASAVWSHPRGKARRGHGPVQRRVW